jgi:hypothetical protein
MSLSSAVPTLEILRGFFETPGNLARFTAGEDLAAS